MDILQTNVLAIKEYASDLQAFLGSKMIETEIKKHEILMQSLFEDSSLQEKDLNCKIADKISNVLTTVTSFGSISVDAGFPLVEMQSEKDKQAQIGTSNHAQLTTINDIKMTLKRKLEFIGITGCSFSSNGDIFLVNNSRNSLLVLKEVGTSKTGIPLSLVQCLDVTCINDKTVAITFPNSNQIQVINILTENVESTIKTTKSCYGICYRDGHLIYCSTGNGIQKVDVSGSYSSTLVKDKTLSDWSFVKTFKDKMFYTNNSKHTVTCCSLTGDKIWEYKDQLVRNPRGIAVDKDSNVYIASQANNCIFVLSSDGKQARKLIESYDEINSPNGLAFEVKNDKLIVANYHGPSIYGFC